MDENEDRSVLVASSAAILVAEALFKEQYPFYTWASQDNNTRWRFIDIAERLIKTLDANGLHITVKDA